MKMIIQLFAVLALLMCALAKDYPPYADFGECETIQQWNQYSVIANCPTPDNKWQCSILVSEPPMPPSSNSQVAATAKRLIAGVGRDLNNCYVNFNGSITPGKGGDFSNSCNDCYWTNTVLHCNCDMNPGHSFMQSQVETNDLVVNYQGFMGCYDRVADACPQGTGPAAPTLAPSAVRSSTTPAPTAALKEMKSFQA
ncbi:hypothetical protein PG996_008125 [Apiospora saccharicola]|uniref:Cyanovirin-N domain-containing protein n=1 Tax=Apiospora saccharicola TaxID=335842 RepID=A0ABR1UX07_9PEZI